MNENRNDNFKKEEPVYSVKQKAGKRRTYFFDVRETKNSDYYITITESKKRDDGSYARHKIYLYKEDINKFLESINTVVGHVKTQLMPDYDYDEFARRQEEYERQRAEENAAGNNSAGDDTSPAPSSSSDSPSPGASSEAPPPPVNDDDLKW